VKGLPADWTPHFTRAEVSRLTDLVEAYVGRAPVEVVGVLSVDADGTPVEVAHDTIGAVILRKATAEPDIMPVPTEFSTVPWSRRR
jgi:hypothetical protein